MKAKNERRSKCLSLQEDFIPEGGQGTLSLKQRSAWAYKGRGESEGGDRVLVDGEKAEEGSENGVIQLQQ